MTLLTDTVARARSAGARIAAEYENGKDERPIGGYVRAMVTYGSLVTGLTVFGRARGVRLPDKVPYDDLALLAVATFRGSRLLAKSAVASPLRAPFTEFTGPGGPGEVMEEVTAEGHLHAVGELLTCPFCLGQWISTLLVAGYLNDPRRTRWVAAALTAAAASDSMQLAYAKLER
jgi:hypothetical protein